MPRPLDNRNDAEVQAFPYAMRVDPVAARADAELMRGQFVQVFAKRLRGRRLLLQVVDFVVAVVRDEAVSVARQARPNVLQEPIQGVRVNEEDTVRVEPANMVGAPLVRRGYSRRRPLQTP